MRLSVGMSMTSVSRRWLGATVAGLALVAVGTADAQSLPVRNIEKVRPSIVAVGTFQQMRAPQFRFLGTGFAIGDGLRVATNAHVVPQTMDAGADPESLVIVVPGATPSAFKVRKAERLAIDAEHDVAILRIDGAPLPALVLRDSATVGEGAELLFTGFPIGAVLGLFPVTHRAMVSAISPIAIPSNDGKQLDPRAVRRLRDSVYPVFQLDATAFPGNSGSPLYEPASGEVVGIINMVFVKASRESVLAQPSGITYAIPSRYLIELLARLKP